MESKWAQPIWSWFPHASFLSVTSGSPLFLLKFTFCLKIPKVIFRKDKWTKVWWEGGAWGWGTQQGGKQSRGWDRPHGSWGGAAGLPGPPPLCTPLKTTMERAEVVVITQSDHAAATAHDYNSELSCDQRLRTYLYFLKLFTLILKLNINIKVLCELLGCNTYFWIYCIYLTLEDFCLSKQMNWKLDCIATVQSTLTTCPLNLFLKSAISSFIPLLKQSSGS